MEDFRQNTGQNLGVAALITAIITFVIAVIPCIGIIAPIPGLIAVVLASVALSQASSSKSPKGLAIAGLIIGIVAIMISFSQIFVAKKISGNADSWSEKIENIVDDIQTNIIKDLEDENVNIKIESNGEVIEITAKKKEKEKLLEVLEGDTLQKDTIQVRK